MQINGAEMTIEQIHDELNLKIQSTDCMIKNLQNERKIAKGLSRKPSVDVFTFDKSKDIDRDWFCHNGGRTELQFNVGIEGNYLRYGVAFSFQASLHVDDPVNTLKPYVAAFNDHLIEYRESYCDLAMWHYDSDGRSKDYPAPREIPDSMCKRGVFIFLGKKALLSDVNYQDMISLFDDLLPLYLYTLYAVNGAHGSSSSAGVKSTVFNFKPGNNLKRSSTTASYSGSTVDVRLIHNDLQAKLYNQLVVKFGAHEVGTEISGHKISVDLALRRPNGKFWIYEIKTANTAKACIRQALGQIMEYSYYPGNFEAEKLVIAGSPTATPEDIQYIRILSSRFNIPITYRAI